MARISLGNFGRQTAEPTPRAPMTVASEGEGLADLGRGAQGLAFTQMRQRTDDAIRAETQRRVEEEKAARERQQALRDAARARATKALAGFEVAALDATDGIQKRLQSGELKTQDVSSEFDRAFKAAEEQFGPEFTDEEHQATFQAHALRMRQRLASGLDGAVQKHVMDRRAADISGALEELDRLAVKDPQSAIARAGLLLDNDGAQVFGAARAQEMKEGFAERASFNHLAMRVEESRRDPRSLKALHKQVREDGGMNPDRKVSLLARIDSNLQHMENLAKAEQARQEALVAKQVGALEALVLKGYIPTAGQFSDALAAAKGTPYEQSVKQLVQSAGFVAKFQGASPQQMDEAIAKLETQVRDNPTTASVSALEKLTALRDTTVKRIREDPLEQATVAGLEVAPIDWSQPDGIQGALQSRVATIMALRKQYGPQVPNKILRDNEAQMLSSVLARGTPEQQKGLLGVISQAIDDPALNRDVMTQIHRDQPMVAVAGDFQARGLRDASGRDVSELILRGNSILKDKQVKLPKDLELQSGWDDVVGKAFTGREQARAAAYQTATAIYAAVAAEHGNFDGTYKAAMWKSAIRLATGGNAVDVNGADVFAPYGMGEDEFRDKVRRALKDAGAPTSAPIEQTAGGYAVRNGAGYLPDPKNPKRPLILRIGYEPSAQGRAEQVDALSQPGIS